MVITESPSKARDTDWSKGWIVAITTAGEGGWASVCFLPGSPVYNNAHRGCANEDVIGDAMCRQLPENADEEDDVTCRPRRATFWVTKSQRDARARRSAWQPVVRTWGMRAHDACRERRLQRHTRYAGPPWVFRERLQHTHESARVCHDNVGLRTIK